jgi:dipeptidyl aminopeptidase/acylaminoacyl peptidase
MNRKGFVLFTWWSLFFIAACGVLEVGIERGAGDKGTATVALTIVTKELTRAATATSTPAMATATPSVPAPSSTPEPTATPSPTAPAPARDSGLSALERPVLQIAFVKAGNVWLWSEGQDARALTSIGDVSDVKISDDGQIVAFVRGLELWAVNSDGSDVRTLVSVEDIDALAEPGDPELRLYSFAWVPGKHVVAFNTRAHIEIGLVLRDDLCAVDADTLEKAVLRPRGQGGQFTYAPDGSQVALVRSGTITLVDADGGNPREVFTYTPPVTYSEVRFYAQPVWAADSRSLRVAIPPADMFAEPSQLTTVWQVYVDGRSARLLASLDAMSFDQNAFSPDLESIAYLALPADTSPGSGAGDLLITHLTEGGTVTHHRGVGQFYGWAPDAQHFAFLVRGQYPQAWIGAPGYDPVPVHADPAIAAIGVNWIDTNRYLYTTASPESRSLFVGEIDGASTGIVAVDGRSLPYDFCLCGKTPSQ